VKETLVPTLCCPACKGVLAWRGSVATRVAEPEGELVCEACNAKYKVQNGIPRLYVGDDEAIGRSDQSKYSDYILDPKHLAARAKTITPSSVEPDRRASYRGISLLAWVGWPLLVIGGVLLLIVSVSASAGSLRVLSWILLSVSFACFALDFWLYRRALNQRQRFQLHKLTELSKAARLSEYDLHTQTDHVDDDEGDPFEDQRKAEEIAQRLDTLGTNGGKSGLNVGCGGALHRLVSKPYFDRGYEMVGVDISESYLSQYRKLFGADAVLANALALPFAPDTFNIVHYCDVLEHMHHPFLGLNEVNRVLKRGGLLILSTNYRCRLSRECANPLILIERMVSLYHDAVLGPRDRMRGFGNMVFYHLDFSKRELIDLFQSAGFEIVEFYTYLYKRESLTNLFRGLPILRFMGDTILVTCRKQSEVSRGN
jgi:ubiquinone/menaquinone biosynthesis C-methylase UbiE/uncharacterized protein YbaR (Trm112 family)